MRVTAVYNRGCEPVAGVVCGGEMLACLAVWGMGSDGMGVAGVEVVVVGLVGDGVGRRVPLGWRWSLPACWAMVRVGGISLGWGWSGGRWGGDKWPRGGRDIRWCRMEGLG
jgi:hypothetical protein